MKMTNDQLQAIRERCEGATLLGVPTGEVTWDKKTGHTFYGFTGESASQAEYQFLANAKADIKSLLAEVERHNELVTVCMELNDARQLHLGIFVLTPGDTEAINRAGLRVLDVLERLATLVEADNANL